MPEHEAKHGRKRHRERRKHKREKGECKRDNVVMVRVDEENLNRIDELVETGNLTVVLKRRRFLSVKASSPSRRCLRRWRKRFLRFKT